MTGLPSAPPGRPADRHRHRHSHRHRHRHSRKRLALLLLLLAAFVGFVALGTWQVERRAWKLELIRRVDARTQAPAGDAPGRSAWASLRPEDDEYRHVRVTGIFDPAASTLVQAVTDLGPGFWVLTPLRRSDDGSTVLVNRGWVADAASVGETSSTAVVVTVTGLLRLSEPGGGFLRRNDPAADRWYSRDVAAIASTHQLTGPVAPYFIDAAVAPANGTVVDRSQPVGGLTVVAFHNSHLIYALTWYGLAAGVGFGVWQVLRSERR